MNETASRTKLLGTIPLFIIFVVALFIYLDAGVFTYGYWNWGDSIFAFFPERMLSENFYLWNVFTGTGDPASYPGALPFYVFIWALDCLGVPLWVASKIVYVLPTAMAGWFMYLLAGCFVGGRYQREARLVAALLYMLMFWSWANAKFTFSFAVVPLILTLFIKGMNSKGNNGFLLAFLFAVSWLMVGIAPPFVPLALVLILSYLIFHGVSNRWHIGAEVKNFLIPETMFSFAFSAFWVVPQLGSNLLGHGLDPVLFKSSEDATSVLYFTQPYTSLIWGFRLMYGYIGDLRSYYDIPIVVVLGFIVPVFVYSALLFHNRRREAAWLATMGILFTVLATGVHYASFSSIYLWLFDHVPFFQAFRIPLKFLYPLILVYACLAGLTTQGILEFYARRITQRRIMNVARIMTVCGIVAVILVQMFPYFRGTEYPGGYGNSMIVPSDYYDLHDYLEANSESGDRLLVLPWQSWYTTYTWYTVQDQPDIVARFAPIPVLGASPDDKLQGLTEMLNDGISSKESNSMPSIVDMLVILGLRYILVHNDIPGTDTSEVLHFLDDSGYFTNVGDYSNFGLLELNRDYPTPCAVAVAADHADSVPREVRLNMQELVDLNFESSPEGMDAAVEEYWNAMSKEEQDALVEFSEAKGVVGLDVGGMRADLSSVAYQWAFRGWVELPTVVGPWYLESDSNDVISSSFTMVDPTHYTGTVNSMVPFVLVLNQTFNSEWVAYINGEAVDSMVHFESNDYANAWRIDKTGTFDVEMKYRPQDSWRLTMVFSPLILVACLCYVKRNNIARLLKKIR